MWRVLFFSTPAPPIPHFSFPAQAIIRWGCAQVTITKKVVALRDKIDTFQVPESRDYIFVAYDNLIRVEPFLHNLPIEEAYQFFLELIELRKQEKFCRYDTVNPRIPKIVNKTINNFLSCRK